jgi:uncharacterized Zn-binding protein involved in type VI secretion
MSNSSYSRLTGNDAGFNRMLRGFGVVTVMNAKVFNYEDVVNACGGDLTVKKVDEILATIHGMENTAYQLCELKTLKVANVTQEGPTKTVTGGQYTNALIKFGKTATMEINDALGNVDAIEALCGGVVEHFKENAADNDNSDVLHISTNFGGPKTILGESFFIDQKSGQQVKVEIIFYQFLPDSIFNLTQDAEGDASVFDMNGSLGVTDIYVGDTTFGADGVVHGVFYSIVSPNLNSASAQGPFTTEVDDDTHVMTVTATGTNTVSIDGATAAASGTIAEGAAARVQVYDANNVLLIDTVVKNY